MNGGCDYETPDSTGWEQWLQRHVPALWLYARQQTRCEADAQDVLQEAILQSWRRHSASGPPPLPLVFASIRRRALDLARSMDRRVQRETAVVQDTPQNWFDPSLEERERGHLLQEAMSALPDLYREAITLKIWGGLTFQQIAEALDIPANTAASRYRYGIEQLRQALKEILT